MRRLLAVTLLLACLSACSDDDTSVPPTTTTTSTTLSEKGAYIAAADGICGVLSAQIKALSAPATLEATALYVQQRIIVAMRARDELAALDPPADGVDVEAALVDALDTSIAKSEEAKDAADQGDAAALGPLLDEARTLGQAAIPVADAYGMTECGSK